MNEDLIIPYKERTKYELIVAVVLLIICIIFYYKWNESKKDLAAYKKTHSVEDTLGKINKPTEEVKGREADLYPKIEANIAQINRDIKSLNESYKTLIKNQPTKEQSDEIFKNKNLTEVSDFFTSHQYPNTIISR